LSYEEGSRQARRPSDPQSLATLLTRLRLATTLRMRALQVESSKYGVCLLIFTVGGIYRAMGELHRHGEINLAPSGGRPASLVERPPPTFSTALAFSTSCRHVFSKPPAKPTQNMANRPRSLSAWGLAHSVHVSNTPLW
jgi:hypothetical protein